MFLLYGIVSRVNVFPIIFNKTTKVNKIHKKRIGHINEYPTMHYFKIPRLSISGNSSEKLYCGNVVDMPYLSVHLPKQRHHLHYYLDWYSSNISYLCMTYPAGNLSSHCLKQVVGLGYSSYTCIYCIHCYTSPFDELINTKIKKTHTYSRDK